MLEYLIIFAKGGAILWQWLRSGADIKGNPVDELIRTVLLEEQRGEDSYVTKQAGGPQYAMKWTFDNGLDLVFVAVYQRALSLMYIDTMLEKLKLEFAKQYKPARFDYSEFQLTFNRVLDVCEKRATEARNQPKLQNRPAGKGSRTGRADGMNGNGARTANGTHRDGFDNQDDGEDNGEAESDGHATGVNGVGGHGDSSEDLPAGSSDDGDLAPGSGSDGDHTPYEKDAAIDGDKLAALKRKVGIRGRGGAKATKGRGSDRSSGNGFGYGGRGSSRGKQARVWDQKGDAAKLDFSNSKPNDEPSTGAVGGDAVEDIAGLRSRVDLKDEEVLDDLDDFDAPEAAEAKKGSSWLSGMVSSITLSIAGKQALTSEDLEHALAALKKKLMERNVAAHVAAMLCDSVASSLEGQRLASFQGVYAMVKRAFEESITRILTPSRSINVLGEIRQSQQRGKPYVMVFCGVNGVGKSTNLSKIAFWLKSNGLRVMIAGCDTFRSGAIEQLRTHSRRLDVPLYERGYEKDAANVAYEAAKQAEKEKYDVLLVDTAGRMQDNEPLMRALSGLIHKNQPNLVLFVGEALVGNDAVDQLTKFNQRLVELSPASAGGKTVRAIDGIILTKYDTIDDKVGAAVSMVYTAKVPIMFVGCGQTYADLDRLRVKDICKKLLK